VANQYREFDQVSVGKAVDAGVVGQEAAVLSGDSGCVAGQQLWAPVPLDNAEVVGGSASKPSGSMNTNPDSAPVRGVGTCRALAG
jgi:hypothetical protein